jgi:hypothetical protein
MLSTSDLKILGAYNDIMGDAVRAMPDSPLFADVWVRSNQLVNIFFTVDGIRDTVPLSYDDIKFWSVRMVEPIGITVREYKVLVQYSRLVAGVLQSSAIGGRLPYPARTVAEIVSKVYEKTIDMEEIADICRDPGFCRAILE